MNKLLYKLLARKEHWIKILCIASPVIALVIPLLLYGALPNDIPMQFDGNGEATWTLTKPLAIFFPFLIIAFLSLYFKTKKEPSLKDVFLQLTLAIFFDLVFVYIAFLR